MKLKITIEGEFTPDDKATMIPFYVCREDSGLIIHDKIHIDRARAEVLKAFTDRLIYNREDLLDWKEEGNSIKAMLTIVPPKVIDPKKLK